MFGCLLLHHLFDVVVQLLLCVYFIRRFNDHVRLDVKFGQIELEIVFVPNKTLPKVFLQFVFEVSCDWVFEQFVPVDSLCRINHQHPPNHILDDFGNFAGERDRLLSNFLQQVNDVGCREWHLAEDHFVKADANRPDVCFAVVRLPVQDLWGHIQRRAQYCLNLLVFCPQ